jgi:hypothetical protein
MRRKALMRDSVDALSLTFKRKDSPTGATRETLRVMAHELGISETATIHLALAMLAGMVLPGYEADEGALEPVDMAALCKRAAVKMPRSKLISSRRLF